MRNVKASLLVVLLFLVPDLALWLPRRMLVK